VRRNQHAAISAAANWLGEELCSHGCDVVEIGDCAAPGTYAFYEGRRAALEL